MKRLHVGILLLGVLQFVRAKPLNSTLPPEEQLKQFYATELNVLSEEICPKLKNITDQILQDQYVQQVSTFLMQKFKKDIDRFQQVYPTYTKFGGYETMVSRFSRMLKDYHYQEYRSDKDSFYIKQLIRNLGYDEIRAKYKSEFGKLVSEKFLPKYEELKSHISNGTGLANDFMKWITKLRNCQEYECYLSKIGKESPSFFDGFFQTLFEELFDGFIIYTHNATLFAKEVANDPKVLQLSTPIRQQLIRNLQDIIRISESVDNIGQMFIIGIFFPFYLYKFDNSTAISEEDRRLISNIFDDHGYTVLGLNQHIKKDGLSAHDHLREFENFKASQDPAFVKQVMDAIDLLGHSTTMEETTAALQKILNLRKSAAEVKE